MRVTLLPDGGAAAAGVGFFRSAPFLAAEGTTHSLVVRHGDSRVALPLIVRTIPDSDRVDGISPYGYPGGNRAGPVLPGKDVDLTAVGLVSAFVRDRLDGPTFGGGSTRGLVILHDPALPRAFAKTFRRDLRRGADAGYSAELHTGREVDELDLAGFAAAYSATMEHVRAGGRYRFTTGYLRACLDVDGSWLIVVRDEAGSIVAGELVVTADGMLHSYLAGTLTAHRPLSPGKLATARAVDLADDLGLPLNFGGGLRPDDGVERSKRSYGNTTAAFLTHELVGDPAVVGTLTGDHPREPGFFPPYRAPTLSAVPS